jgi:hypothetical protein
MGHPTHGLILGIHPPKGVDLYGDLEDNESRWPSGLLNTWQAHCRARIDKFAKRYSLGYSDHPETRLVPANTWGPIPLIGFWVALGSWPVGLSGVPYMSKPFMLNLPGFLKVPKYARVYKRAVRRWKRFDKWARSQGLLLPAPRLWLAETELP